MPPEELSRVAATVRLEIVALDYDGTIAEQGLLAPAVADVLVEARSRGIVPILVTGRILGDLERLLDRPTLFDAVVAENGAVVSFPSSDRTLLLAEPPPPSLLDELRRRQVPFLAGEVVVEMGAENAPTVLQVIRDLELPLVLHFNRDRLMILPQAISKASGVREALRALRLSIHNAVAIGDAENDHQLLDACELGLAVAWGSEALKGAADDVIPGDRPADIAPYLRRLIEQPLPPPRRARRRLHLGLREGGEALTLAMLGRNVLIAGDTQSGKSWLAGLLCEQLILLHYCVCIIDPEGEYSSMEYLPSVVSFQVYGAPPALADIERALRYPDVSVVIDLSEMEAAPKRAFIRELLFHLRDLRARTGLPHRIVLDEAHYFLGEEDAAELLELDSGGYLLVTYRASQLDRSVLAAAGTILVTRISEPLEARALLELCPTRSEFSEQEWRRTLLGLGLDEAVLLPGSEQSADEIVRFRLPARLTSHVRHRHKYRSVPLSLDRSFILRRGARPTGDVARSLEELAAILAREPPFTEHFHNRDFSKWIRGVFHDPDLAEEVESLEADFDRGRSGEVCQRLVELIRRRYGDLD